MLPFILRWFIPRLIVHKFTYFIGMVLIRFSRKCRAMKKDEKQVFTVVNNFAKGLKIKVNMNGYMGGAIYWTGLHHVNEYIYLHKILRQDDVFIDVGANQGEFTLLAASICYQGHVYAFEPVAVNYKLLKENIGLNHFKQVSTFDVGLFNEVKTTEIFTPVFNDGGQGLNEGVSTLFKPENDQEIQTEEIKLAVFDDLLFGKLERFDVLKIDIEGAELFALQGMKRSLEKFKPQILIEINHPSDQSHGYSPKDIVQFLNSLGYRSYTLFRGDLKPVDEMNMKLPGNFVFKHESE